MKPETEDRNARRTDRAADSRKLRVAVVADGTVELTPQQLLELGIGVVPRTASLGRRRLNFDADFTAASLAAGEKRPRKVSWRVEDVQMIQAAYARETDAGRAVLAYHVPLLLDQGTREARRARNLLWPQPVHLLEPPLLGMGRARLVALMANLAAQGLDAATLRALHDFATSLVKTLLIVPARARDELFVDATNMPEETKPKLFGNRHLMCEIRREDGRLQIVDARPDPVLFGEKLVRYVTHMRTRRVPMVLTWRAARYDKHLQAWQDGLSEYAIEQESAAGWSPHVTALVGTRWLEICLAPPHRELLRLARKFQLNFAQQRQAADLQERPRRLSDYEIEIH